MCLTSNECSITPYIPVPDISSWAALLSSLAPQWLLQTQWRQQWRQQRVKTKMLPLNRCWLLSPTALWSAAAVAAAVCCRNAAAAVGIAAAMCVTRLRPQIVRGWERLVGSCSVPRPGSLRDPATWNTWMSKAIKTSLGRRESIKYCISAKDSNLCMNEHCRLLE